jgi:GMP synthase (glutamine-hydrolysing)
MAYTFGGNVEPEGTREYGRANLEFMEKDNPILKYFA